MPLRGWRLPGIAPRGGGAPTAFAFLATRKQAEDPAQVLGQQSPFSLLVSWEGDFCPCCPSLESWNQTLGRGAGLCTWASPPLAPVLFLRGVWDLRDPPAWG